MSVSKGVWLSCCLIAFLLPMGISATPASIITPSVPPTMRKPTGLASIEPALQAFEQGDAAGSHALLKQATQADSNLPPADVLLAQLYLSKGQLSFGRSVLERAAIETPDSPEVYLAFGDLALFEQRLTDARLHYLHAISLAGSQPAEPRSIRLRGRALSGLAAVAEGREDWREAAELLNRWAALEPKNPQPPERLGRALFYLDRHDDALSQFEQAFRLEPGSDPPPLAIAWLFAQAGRQEQSQGWWEKAVQQFASDPNVHLAYAQWLLETGVTSSALQEAEKAMELATEPTTELRLLCAQLSRTRMGRSEADLERAEQLCRQALALQPTHEQAANELSRCLVESRDSGKLDQGLELAQQLAAKSPGSPLARMTLAKAFVAAGRLAEAEGLMSSVAAGGSLSSDDALMLAEVLDKRGRRREAIDLVNRALEATGPFLRRPHATQLLEEWQR